MLSGCFSPIMSEARITIAVKYCAWNGRMGWKDINNTTLAELETALLSED